MARNDVRIGLWVLAAAVVGFVLALVLFGGSDNNGNSAVVTSSTTATTGPTTTQTSPGATTTTQTTTAGATPQTPDASPQNCINLWNEAGNRGAQTFMINIAAQQPIRVHVGQTTDVPPKCLITVVANNGDAYVFPEGGGTTFPYAPAPTRTAAGSLPAEQRKSNALEQRDGTLVAH